MIVCTDNFIKLYGTIITRHGSFESFEKFHQLLVAVTSEQVVEVVRKYFNPDDWSVIIMGKVS